MTMKFERVRTNMIEAWSIRNFLGDTEYSRE